MSATKQDPTLIPGHVLVGKEETMVLEFPRDLPALGFITLTFYDEQTRAVLASIPAAQLGPRTLKANFPGFRTPGKIEVSIQFTREENPHFPRFQLTVLSPLEAAAKILGSDRFEASLPVMCGLLAFLAHSERGEREGNTNLDSLLCGLLHSVSPADLPDWRLGSLLSGAYSWDENLLHFCMREKLNETALVLLQPQHFAGKAEYLVQKSSMDNRTPLELAHKAGMTRVGEMADSLTAGKNFKAVTPKEKRKKKGSFPRASSVDTNLHLACDDAVDQSPSVTTPKKKEKGKLRWLFRGDAKDKEAKAPISAQRPVSATTHNTTHEDSDSPVTCSDSGSISSQVFSVSPVPPPSATHLAPRTYPPSLSPTHSPSHCVEQGDFYLPDSERDTYTLVGQDGNLSPKHDVNKFRSISISREQMMPLPHELPQRPVSSVPNFTPSSLGGSGANFPLDLPPLPSRTPDNPLPLAEDVPLSILREQEENTSSTGHEALSAAVSDLMKRCIFVGAVTRDYRWPSNTTGSSGEFSVRVGERVHVIEETEEGFRGVCRNRYKTFPKDTLRIMTPAEIKEVRGFSEVESEEEDVLYKEPRNVPRVEDSASEEEEDHYKVPRNVLRAIRSDSEEGEIYNVPRSILNAVEANEEGIYNVPRKIDNIDDSDSDEHDYELPPIDPSVNIESQQNNILHNLPEGHYMKVPSRQLLEKHSPTHPANPGGNSGANPRAPLTSTTGSPALDKLLAMAAKKDTMGKKNVSTELENEADDIYDYPPSSSPSPPEHRAMLASPEDEENDEEGNIYDQILPITNHRKSSLQTNITDTPNVPQSHVSVTSEDPDDIDDDNIYDVPTNPIPLRETQKIMNDELPTVYDELAKISDIPQSHPSLGNSLGRDWKASKDVGYSPKTHPKHGTAPGKFSYTSPLSYGDSGPVSEYDQHREEKPSPSSDQKLASTLPRHHPPQHRKGEYEEIPLRLEPAKHGENSDKSEPEVINVYGKVTSTGKGGRGGLRSETSQISTKHISTSVVANDVSMEHVAASSRQSVQDAEENDAVFSMQTAEDSSDNFETKQQAASPTLMATRQQHPLPPEASKHHNNHRNLEKTTSNAPPPPPSPKPKPKVNRKSFFPDEPSIETTTTTTTTRTFPIPARRTRAPTTPATINSSPTPVPKPRRHMTDTSPPATTKQRSQTLNRMSATTDADMESPTLHARTLESPKLSNGLARKKPAPAIAPKPQSPDMSRRQNRTPDLPPRNPHPPSAASSSTAGSRHTPTVGPKLRHKPNSPPSTRSKYPLPPPTSPKTGRARTSASLSHDKSPKRSSTSVAAVSNSPPLPPKPLPSFKKTSLS